MRASGRSANLMRKSGKPKSAVDLRQQLMNRAVSAAIWSSVQKICASSWVNCADAHDAVQRAGGFVAVARPELRHPQRQFAVGPHAVAENLDMAGAVHRLQRQDFVLVLHLGDEHVLAVVLPVAGLLPQRPVEQLRGLHLLVAGGIQATAQIGLAVRYSFQPFGCQKIEPTASSWIWNRSISLAILRWSRRSASSNW